MNDESLNQRLHGKFHVVRTDGKANRAHDKFFVLNYGHDAAARNALLFYARQIELTKPGLALDLQAEIERAIEEEAKRKDAETVIDADFEVVPDAYT